MIAKLSKFASNPLVGRLRYTMDEATIARRVAWAKAANYRVSLEASEAAELLAEIETLRAENSRLRAENDLLVMQLSRHASQA